MGRHQRNPQRTQQNAPDAPPVAVTQDSAPRKETIVVTYIANRDTGTITVYSPAAHNGKKLDDLVNAGWDIVAMEPSVGTGVAVLQITHEAETKSDRSV